MSKGWASRLTRWQPHVEATVNYPLLHVAPFRFKMQMQATQKYAARDIEIRVGFSHHCFTDTKTRRA
jgi:hypothetical protein